MGVIATLFPVEIHFRIAIAASRDRRLLIFGPKALQRCPGFDQRVVNGEMVAGQESCRQGLGTDGSQEHDGKITVENALSVFGIDRVIPNRFIHGQADKPAKKKIVMELFG